MRLVISIDLDNPRFAREAQENETTEMLQLMLCIAGAGVCVMNSAPSIAALVKKWPGTTLRNPHGDEAGSIKVML